MCVVSTFKDLNCIRCPWFLPSEQEKFPFVSTWSMVVDRYYLSFSYFLHFRMCLWAFDCYLTFRSPSSCSFIAKFHARLSPWNCLLVDSCSFEQMNNNIIIINLNVWLDSGDIALGPPIAGRESVLVSLCTHCRMLNNVLITKEAQQNCIAACLTVPQ